MPVDYLFAVGPEPRFSTNQAFNLATLLHAMEVSSGDYMQAWKTINHVGAYFYHKEATGWPLPYTVAYHPDGVVLAFSGLRNLEQFAAYVLSSSLVDYFRCAGKVLSILRLGYEAIRTNLETRVANAPNKSRIVICGHSAGGALASIAWAHMKAIYGAGAVQQCYTFGAPKPGQRAHVETLTGRYFSVENIGDVVPAFPYATSLLTPGIAIGPALMDVHNAGQPIALATNGNQSMHRPWQRNMAIARSVLAFLRDTDNTAGVAHSLEQYTHRLGLQAPAGQGELSMNRELLALNNAISGGYEYYDKLNPVPPDSSAVVAAPPAPTIPQVQEIPAGNGDPGGPAPGPADVTLVGQTARVYGEATVTVSSHPPRNRFWVGDDKRLIERYLYALQLFIRRDLDLSRKPVPARISTLTPFFGADDEEILESCLILQEHFLRLLDMQNVTVPLEETE